MGSGWTPLRQEDRYRVESGTDARSRSSRMPGWNGIPGVGASLVVALAVGRDDFWLEPMKRVEPAFLLA